MEAKTKKPGKPKGPELTEGYFRMVRAFPLVKIADDAQLDAAIAMIDKLLILELDSGEDAYLDTLSELVAAYEDEHVVFPEVYEGGALRGLMDSNRLTQAQLASEVGIAQSTISAVLTGSRSLTKAQIMKLAERFHVPASVFLPG
jgi:HTH-type transcriptional regulator/antitoxin HigA